MEPACPTLRGTSYAALFHFYQMGMGPGCHNVLRCQEKLELFYLCEISQLLKPHESRCGLLASLLPVRVQPGETQAKAGLLLSRDLSRCHEKAQVDGASCRGSR